SPPSSSGLTRGSTPKLSAKLLIKITPFRIKIFNQLDFPVAIPALQRFLALDGGSDAHMLLIPDEARTCITTGKTFRQTLAVFVYSLLEVGRDADIERSVSAARDDINEAGHGGLPKVDPRVKPEDDAWGVVTPGAYTCNVARTFL